MTNTRVVVDAGKWLGEFRHMWNYIGYDEINYTTVPDGEKTLEKFMHLAERQYYVRAHHLLCTGNCLGIPKWGSTNVYLEDEAGNPVYSWEIIDEIFDTLLKYNLKPFVELGFMPLHLADDRGQRSYRDGGWACPPKDYDKWYGLIYELVKHCVERYGPKEVASWYWELWNEPDLTYYWKGSLEEFCKLYDYTVAAVEAAFPKAQVGGPATCGPMPDSRSSQWLDGFLDHCVNGTNYYTKTTGTRMDFITFHAKGANYGTDVRAAKQLPSTKSLVSQVRLGLDIINKYPPLKDLPCILSECDPDGWAAGGAWDNPNLAFRNTEYYASYVATTFKKLIDTENEYNRRVDALSWAFMFDIERCFEGTRTFTTQGIDKPILNLFRMYSHLGDRRLHFESSGAKAPLQYKDDHGIGEEPDIDGIATMSGNRSVEVFLFCHHDDWDVGGEYEVEIEVANLPFAGNKVRLKHYRIDELHSNAHTEWVRQGRPKYPNPGQRRAIESRQGLELYEPEAEVLLLDGKLRKKITLPVHSMSLLVITGL